MYKINGTDITIQPETGKWVDRDKLGRDGNGRNVYVARVSLNFVGV